MFTVLLQWFGVIAVVLSPVLAYVALRLRLRRAELVDLHDRVDTRDATIAALWDAYLELRYWLAKGQNGPPPTMPDTLSIAAVRARLNA